MVSCARCRYDRDGGALARKYGRSLHVVQGQSRQTTWLAERDKGMPGAWGVGCKLCAYLLRERASELPERARCSTRLTSHWPHFCAFGLVGWWREVT